MGFRDMLKKKSSSDDDDDDDFGHFDPPDRSEPAPVAGGSASFSASQRQQEQLNQLRNPALPRTAPPRPAPPPPLQTPEFTFIRSDTHSQEVIHPPSGPGGGLGSYSDEDENSNNYNYNRAHLQAGGGDSLASPTSPHSNSRRSFDVFRRSSRSSRSSRSGSVSSSSHVSREKDSFSTTDKEVASAARRLSHRLHLKRTPSTSTHVPANLPEIVVPEGEGEGGNKASSLSAASSAEALTEGGSSTPARAPSSAASSSPGAKSRSRAASTAVAVDPIVESQWEKRATLLALENEKQQLHSSTSGANSRPTTPEQRERMGSRGRTSSGAPGAPGPSSGSANRSRSNSAVASKELDASIQEAIRLHEDGQLEQSTRMFGILADPRGYNNPLSQVLYGLALRHGWGCSPDTEAAVGYLSAAASNAAAVEDMALQAGIKKGGAAKGELVLAIFELANCFRHGWGLEKDPIAAKQYYETAANLGDTDAMNEVAWCYLEGFGCKKDKFSSAKYYRLAEQNGNKTIGNTWIWKEKYDPGKQKKK